MILRIGYILKYKKNMENFKFEQGRDYYLEKGVIIMTESYLMKRGTCCGSNCRHCPYWPVASKGNTELRKINPKDLTDNN
jgi:hypothetical protein